MFQAACNLGLRGLDEAQVQEVDGLTWWPCQSPPSWPHPGRPSCGRHTTCLPAGTRFRWTQGHPCNNPNNSGVNPAS